MVAVLSGPLVGMSDERKKLHAQLNKRFGAGAIMRLGDPDAMKRFKVDVIPTHSLRLNRILGRGGIPRGRLTVVFGPEHSGKSALALAVIAEAQKAGGLAGYVDPEYGLDPDFAKQMGVNLDDLDYVQPPYGEAAMDIAEAMIESGLYSVVVVDSLAALVPKAELEGTNEDQQVGLQARLIGKALRKISGAVGRTKTALICINQLRETMAMHGPKETQPGGRAPKFWASVMVEVRRTEFVKNGDNVIGHKVRFKTIKNRLAPPQKVTEVSVIYGQGVDQIDEIVEVCIEEGIITRAGAWYTLRKENGDPVIKDGKDVKWNGSKPINDECQSNPAFFQYLKDRFYAKLAGDGEVEEAPETETEPTDEELVADSATHVAAAANTASGLDLGFPME